MGVIKGGLRYVPRPLGAGYDFSTTDLPEIDGWTADALDLKPIVPLGARCVRVIIHLNHTVMDTEVKLRGNATTKQGNIVSCVQHVSVYDLTSEGDIFVDDDLLLDVYTYPLMIAGDIGINIKGWWI